MPPEADVDAKSRESLRLWRELQRAYDDIARGLARPDGADLRALGERIVVLERELQPLVADVAAARAARPDASSELQAVWRDIDAVVESLAVCQPMLLRAARAARDESAARLAAAQSGRRGVAGYARRGRAEPLASRHA
jgi:hypothetical protein